MFQYAFYRKLKAMGRDVKLDLDWYKKCDAHNGLELERIFDINLGGGTATPREKRAVRPHALIWLHRKIWKRLSRKRFNEKFYWVDTVDGYRAIQYDERFLEIDGVYLSGYWQTEKYFSGIENEIKTLFKFRDCLRGKNREYQEQIQSDEYESVSLHVRRGDYVGNSEVDICGKDYYQRTLEIICSKVKKPKFFVFSDDLAWCRQNLGIENAVYVAGNTGGDSYKDMQLMALCRHHIIPNSSFSWWGAWLGEKEDSIVIGPKRWFNGREIHREDIIPDRWIKV